jgi:hypothetical protein
MAIDFRQSTYLNRSGGNVLAARLAVGDEEIVPGNLVQELTASGAITLKNGLVLLNHATVAIAATLPAPTAIGQELIIVDSSASGTAAHTVTVPGAVTWDGTNDVATLNAPGEALHVIAISLTRWLVLENIGSVAFS